MKILVFGFGGQSTAAVSYILKNSFKLISNEPDFDITFFGCSNNNVDHQDSNIKYIFIKDKFNSKSFNFYRFNRKLRYITKKDTLCLGWKYVFKKAKKLFKNEHFDYVVGASGSFMYMEAAYNFATQKRCNFVSIYFDSFTNKTGIVDKIKRLTYEKKWYECASNVLISYDDAALPFADTRRIVKEFCVPIFKKDHVMSKNGEYVYGGIFYDAFRPQNILDSFIDRVGPNERFSIYSTNYKKEKSKTKENVSVHNMVDADSFGEICKNSKAIIVLGNGENTISSPSKIMSALSFHKPIIGLNFKDIPIALKNYPLYFDGDDPEVALKINNLYSNNRNFSFDLYNLYKDRDPQLFKDILLTTFGK